jgi:hypothetical protein
MVGHFFSPRFGIRQWPGWTDKSAVKALWPVVVPLMEPQSQEQHLRIPLGSWFFKHWADFITRVELLRWTSAANYQFFHIIWLTGRLSFAVQTLKAELRRDGLEANVCFACAAGGMVVLG